jgi:hypothetical protein
MPHVELPRPLEDYFAFAELEGVSDTRRFTITCPYLAERQLGRLQWWWRVSHLELSALGDAGLAERKAREVERFRRHIERWLENTRQRLRGEDAIPRIEPMPPPVEQAAPAPSPEESAVIERRTTRVVNG